MSSGCHVSGTQTSKTSQTSQQCIAKLLGVGIVDNMRHTTESQLGGHRGDSRRSSTPHVLHKLMAALDVTDAELGRRLNVSRQTIHSRRTGRTPMAVEDVYAIASALNVDPVIFLGTASAALAWLAEHRAQELDEPSRTAGGRPEYECTRPSLLHLGRGADLEGAGIPVRWAA